MKKNVGNLDKVVRVAIAAVVSGLYFADVVTGTLGIILMVLAGIFLVTSLVSFCPIYAIVGLSTCKVKNA
ncbi:MAG: DUF2892 domain-containing protein [Bacteroidetes bacterium]|nr:DUF2892 domain-containing protein [Bacteroidota bacterium]